MAILNAARPPGVRDAEKSVLVGFAVLYNPLVPIELWSRAPWTIVNLGTPVFFINGRALAGAYPSSSLQKIIEEALRKR
ncbi:MAG: hypothetical protein A3I61_11240 [Acidobacteria bacterium RIFCSPLOWO2_02_FULL_68_18]|nr:MAG: hypothetical protein A3I61_11240 [Acidobacteria bacterium RIFCSPLOWO2_02_FULL_68_18]OFW50641.1 MAG: hypothetical protein A3G77_16985 [Acidobacteria bacterium RIFCSPLOWO2_12_FULL_68_19]